MIDKDNIIKGFDDFANSKRQNTIVLISSLLLALAIVIMVLIWGYRVSAESLNKIVVVERSGEYLKISSEKSERLFQTMIKTTCSHIVHYANSFDRLTIRDNQAKALFYGDKLSLDVVFLKYNSDASYHEALENGVVYDCQIERFGDITGHEPPYKVSFTSILEVKYLDYITHYRIHSQGEIIKTTPQYPENVTGFFFKSYQQSIVRFDPAEEKRQAKLQERLNRED